MLKESIEMEERMQRDKEREKRIAIEKEKLLF